MTGYPYDDAVLQELAERLYAALPAMYRVPDEGRGELRALVEVLGAPLAVVRQSIDELHADLFVDTGHDRMLPYLAEMVGTRLVFPDAPSNRRDVRGTVAWRRRKGTPVALEEMGGELTGQSVLLQEGWKRVQIAQDLDLVRPERVAPDLRPAVVAEQATGPLDALAHGVDVRAISASTGRHHPRHVTHWVQPTVTFPLLGATAAERSVPGSDVRFAFDPLGGRHALRARRPPGDRRPFVDRIPELHFAAEPERWFGREGGFTVRVCRLPAGIAGQPQVERVAHDTPARPALGRGNVSFALLDQPSRGWRGPMTVELGLVTVVGGAGPDAWRPNPAQFVRRAGIELDAGGIAGVAPAAGPAAGTRVPLLRLAPVGGVAGRFFPGATLEIASDAPGATTSADDGGLAREGFLQGVLHVRIPPVKVLGERFLHVAADGSLYDVAASDGTVRDMPFVDGARRLDAETLVSAGPGAAWPPLPAEAEPRPVGRLPGAPGHGPALLHGGRVVHLVGANFENIGAGVECALVFAAQTEEPGGATFRPFAQLSWTGPDPAAATWDALDAGGQPVAAGAVAGEMADVADAYHADPDRIGLAVRFESAAGDATLCPAEVAWTSDDGTPTLIHLPQLDVAAVLPGADWPVSAPFTSASEPVRAAADGSTWAVGSTANRRFSLGAVAPIAEAAGLRRRRVRWRRLCAWDNEDWAASPPQTLPLTRPGRLDVDVAHGLFAFAASEPPQAWPAGPAPAPPSVTTDHEEGATMHLGALPAAREPELNLRLPRPTRLVSRSGTVRPDAPPDWHEIPRYTEVGDALDAVDQAWSTVAPADIPGFADPTTDVYLREVIQFEDSSTYALESPAWPREVADAQVRARAKLSLTIQAAERARPVVLVDAAAGWSLPAGAAALEALVLRGIAVGGDGWGGMTMPQAERCLLEFCTVLHSDNALTFGAPDEEVHVFVNRCATAGLDLAGPGTLGVADGIVDAPGAAPGGALAADTGRVALDRVSVGGQVEVRALEASEVIFDDRVVVEDRFHGCVRYSRVTTDSVLPRVHRVAFDAPVRVVSRNRRDAAWWRLAADADEMLARGAESGSEIGAFSMTRAAERMVGFERRLEEFTPAGLVTGIVRVD